MFETPLTQQAIGVSNTQQSGEKTLASRCSHPVEVALRDPDVRSGRGVGEEARRGEGP